MEAGAGTNRRKTGSKKRRRTWRSVSSAVAIVVVVMISSQLMLVLLFLDGERTTGHQLLGELQSPLLISRIYFETNTSALQTTKPGKKANEDRVAVKTQWYLLDDLILASGKPFSATERISTSPSILRPGDLGSMGIQIQTLESELPTYTWTMDVVHAAWTPLRSDSVRATGLGPDARAASDGGLAVLGSWPEKLSRLSYLHLHKCGGTSLMNAIGDLRQRLGAKVDVHGTGRKLTKIFEEAQSDQIQERQRISRSGNDTDSKMLGGNAIFTVLRDPVSRFLSSTGEMMRHNELLKTSLSKEDCLKGSVTELFRCVLTRLKQLGPSFDPHFYPQVMEIMKMTWEQKNLSIGLFPFDEIKKILLELGCDRNRNERPRAASSYFESIMNGTKHEDWAATLSKMSVDDLSEDMKRDVCQIYDMDVKLMRYFGMHVPYCS